MYAIVGLGNPGPKYQLTRHNIGFLVIDVLNQHFESPRENEQFSSLVTRAKFDDQDLILVKPQTFMNLSGEAVQPLLAFFKIPLTNLLVIQDDCDMAFGHLKFQRKRGHGGHNGIRNIHDKLGTDDYARLKIGVGRPADPRHDIADYLLRNFSGEQEEQLPDVVGLSAEAVLGFIDVGFERAQNEYNTRAEAAKKD